MATQPARLARTNYPIRAGSFGYAFVIVAALALERQLPVVSLAYPVLALLVYPHLAYLYARQARDPRWAELTNLLIDAAVLGVLAGQYGLPLWLSCAALLGVTVNNAICAGTRPVAYAIGLFAACALAWNFVGGAGVMPNSGAWVTALCALGIVGYATSVGLVMHRQNSYLIATRNELRKSEQLFRVIAEHAGDLVAVLDRDSKLMYLSGESQKRFASAAGDGGWTSLVHGPERVRAQHFAESLVRTRMKGRGAFHLTGADGSLIVMECEGMPVLGPDGELAMLVLVGHEYVPPVLADEDTGAA